MIIYKKTIFKNQAVHRLVLLAPTIFCRICKAKQYINVTSEYGHLSKWIVTKYQKVKQGQIIAYSGNTGYSHGPHLHLTIRHGYPGKGGGRHVNPWDYIRH